MARTSGATPEVVVESHTREAPFVKLSTGGEIDEMYV